MRLPNAVPTKRGRPSGVASVMKAVEAAMKPLLDRRADLVNRLAALDTEIASARDRVASLFMGSHAVNGRPVPRKAASTALPDGAILTRTGKVVSAEARQRMGAAQKRRWRAYRRRKTLLAKQHADQ